MNTCLQSSQLGLFESMPACIEPAIGRTSRSRHKTENLLEQAPFCSEVSLSGRAEHCLHLLAPMLKLLSEQQEDRWLTLVSPPQMLTMQWLREAGLNPQKTLILHPRGLQSSQELACQVLELGCSHTVVSWLSPLPAAARRRLSQAAHTGGAQSINITQQFAGAAG